jgi:hypothetical protein
VEVNPSSMKVGEALLTCSYARLRNGSDGPLGSGCKHVCHRARVALIGIIGTLPRVRWGEIYKYLPLYLYLDLRAGVLILGTD